MTPRRRFFPAQRTQQVPGQAVALEVQLSPELPAPKPSGACECDVLGPALMPAHNDDTSSDPPRYTEAGPYVYKPRRSGWRLTGGYVYVPSPWGAPCKLHAVLAGPTVCAVEWEWTLAVPELPSMEGYSSTPWWGGAEVLNRSGVLEITVLPGELYTSDAWWAELRITALCAGKPAGELVLRPGNNVWNVERLPEIQ